MEIMAERELEEDIIPRDPARQAIDDQYRDRFSQELTETELLDLLDNYLTDLGYDNALTPSTRSIIMMPLALPS